MKNHYAFAHSFGSTTHVQGAPHGDGGQLHVFCSAADRDDWIAEGPDYVGSNGARTKYPFSRVRAHVVTGDCAEIHMTTVDLVDQSCEIYVTEDHR